MNGEQRGGPAADPATAALRMAAALLSRPLGVARCGADLVVELGRIGLGTSPLTPAHGRPLWRRAVAVHAAATGAVAGLLDEAALARADDRVLRGLLDTVADALDPARLPSGDGDRAAPGTPADTGPPVDTRAPVDTRTPAGGPVLRVGEELAATPGAVVLRTESFELLHYLPQTREVRAVPVLVVAPPTARYYLADLAPGRSIVEHLVRAGQQVLAVSWRNPGPEHAGWDLDTYGRAVLDAIDACTRIARVPAVALLGLGDGARLTTLVLGHLAATGRQELVACAAVAPADPHDGLAGQPADVRAWAADVVRVPDALRAALARAAAGSPAGMALLGTPVDPDAVVAETYVVTAATDPLRWRPGGSLRVVTVAGGDAGSLVAPPGTSEAGFVVGPGVADPAAGTSWWTDLAAWLDGRTGEWCEAPAELGGRRMPAVAPAPGEYVLARV